MSRQPLLITETILRDAHQSQAATRMRTEEMLPACALLDGIGYWSVECWGGATFDACLRFLDEDPWERLRALRKAMPNTRLQMLLRGQNLLGYRNYPDDVVDSFCKKSLENGIDVVRIFDALNDLRNISRAMKSVKEYGGHCEPAISYTVSPIHNEQSFIDLALRLEDMGADTICIKDMSNLLLPMDAYHLILELKKHISAPIHLHTHNTSGTGDMTYLMASLAGVDIVDCALSPLGNGAAQPATESLTATLRGQERDTGLDLAKLSEAAHYFRSVAVRLEKEGYLDPKVLLRGEYGQLPGDVDEAVRQKVIGEDEVITCRPADLLTPEMETRRQEAGGLARSDEDVLSLAMLPQPARSFLERRNARIDAALRREQSARARAEEQKHLIRSAEKNKPCDSAGTAAGNSMARNCKEID